MGHFNESPYANPLFTNATILTIITTTTTVPPRKQHQPQHTPLSPKKPSPLFVPVVYNGEGISASSRARELFLGQIAVELNFPIHLCTLQVWWLHQGRTLTVERSPLTMDSRKGLWLQGEAVLQKHSFRDADPQPVFPQKIKILNIPK